MTFSPSAAVDGAVYVGSVTSTGVKTKPLLVGLVTVCALGAAVLVALWSRPASPGRSAAVATTTPRWAELEEVTGFGPNPSNLKMYAYVPTSAGPRSPVVVGLHWCHGDAPAFHSGTRFAALADKYGFILVYPSVTRSDGCFDVASAAALRRDGDGDPTGIMSMVRHAQRLYHADPERVFVTGLSSGAMMTNVLLALYPDVFDAGVAFAGVPFGCFAGPIGWNDVCAGGRINRTPRQWGDAVRAAYPGYQGPRPKVQLWHGVDDEVLNFANLGEEVDQWTDVLGAGPTPTSTDRPVSQRDWTRASYVDATGAVQVEAVTMPEVSHRLPVQEVAALTFFGLTDS